MDLIKSDDLFRVDEPEPQKYRCPWFVPSSRKSLRQRQGKTPDTVPPSSLCLSLSLSFNTTFSITVFLFSTLCAPIDTPGSDIVGEALLMPFYP